MSDPFTLRWITHSGIFNGAEMRTIENGQSQRGG